MLVGVRVRRAAAFLFFVLAACGGVSTHKEPGDSPPAGTGGAPVGAAGMSAGECAEPRWVVPELSSSQSPPNPTLSTFQITLRNQCSQTLWPAYGSSGGLDNSIIDSQLWLPLPATTERSVTVYGGVRELGFWGRSRCSFDRAGEGTCETGDCGGFVCPIRVNQFPESATVFILERGFLEGYNVPLRVEGTTCGSHECVAELSSCSRGPVVKDACGNAIGCRDLCSGSALQCCSKPGSGCGSTGPSDGNGGDDLVVTFCP